MWRRNSTLLSINYQVVIIEALVLLLVRIDNGDVINVSEKELQLCWYTVNHSWKGFANVPHAKGHMWKLEETEWRCDGCLENILSIDRALMAPLLSILLMK